jgi:hypothetical protein
MPIRLDLLNKKSKPELLAVWQEFFPDPPPAHLRRDLLLRIIAYKVQEQAYGGLKLETRKRLRELAAKFAINRDAQVSGVQRIKTGTRMVRDWGGRTHQVTTLDNAFEYAGKHYASLSEVARVITGTRWSGPLFFGLKGNSTKAPTDGQRT